MRLGILAVIAVASASGAAAAPSLEVRLIALERQSWAAWQAQDSRFWQTFLSGDHVELHGSGPVGKAAVIGGIASGACHVEGYALANFSFRRFGPDTALLVYRAEQHTTCGGARAPSPVWASSLYQRRHGRWLNVYYSHLPIRAGH